MVDILYNVINRPVANEPNKKDIYHVDKSHKDEAIKKINEDDPKQQQQQESENKEQQPDQKGKGKYKDDDGVEHLDIFV